MFTELAQNLAQKMETKLRKIADLIRNFSTKSLESQDTVVQVQSVQTPGTGEYAEVKNVQITMNKELAERCEEVEKVVTEARNEVELPKNITILPSKLFDEKNTHVDIPFLVEKEMPSGKYEKVNDAKISINFGSGEKTKIQVQHIGEDGKLDGSEMIFNYNLDMLKMYKKEKEFTENFWEQKYEETFENPIKLLESQVEDKIAALITDNKNYDTNVENKIDGSNGTLHVSIPYLIERELQNAERDFQKLLRNNPDLEKIGRMTINFEKIMLTAQNNPDGVAFKNLNAQFSKEKNSENFIRHMRFETDFVTPNFGQGYVTSKISFDTPKLYEYSAYHGLDLIINEANVKMSERTFGVLKPEKEPILEKIIRKEPLEKALEPLNKDNFLTKKELVYKRTKEIFDNPIRLLENEFERRIANLVPYNKYSDFTSIKSHGLGNNKNGEREQISINMHYLIEKELHEAEKAFEKLKKDNPELRGKTMTIDFENVMKMSMENPKGIVFQTLDTKFSKDGNFIDKNFASTMKVTFETVLFDKDSNDILSLKNGVITDKNGSPVTESKIYEQKYMTTSFDSPELKNYTSRVYNQLGERVEKKEESIRERTQRDLEQSMEREKERIAALGEKMLQATHNVVEKTKQTSRVMR